MTISLIAIPFSVLINVLCSNASRVKDSSRVLSRVSNSKGVFTNPMLRICLVSAIIYLKTIIYSFRDIVCKITGLFPLIFTTYFIMSSGTIVNPYLPPSQYSLFTLIMHLISLSERPVSLDKYIFLLSIQSKL